jgi:ribonuclease HI
MAQKKYYAVAAGRKPGIYTKWFGADGAQVQVIGFAGAIYKGFATQKEAADFMAAGKSAQKKKCFGSAKRGKRSNPAPAASQPDHDDRIVIYTDGSSLGNPGPGGYGVVIPKEDGDREFSGGFRKTTNNRMELLACIVGLEQLDARANVLLYSDSRYVVDGITKGWARNWQRKGWRKSNGATALNPDLWQRLLALCARHDVQFSWVKGHAGNPGNERCDRLANQAAADPDLPVDEGYENGLKYIR